MYPNVVRNSPGSFVPERDWVSVDFEFPWGRPLSPTITGLSSGGFAHSGYHNDRWVKLLDDLDRGGVTWLGHNALTTEKKILEHELGREIPLDRMDDTMVAHYLCNAELCKGVSKGEEGEDGDEQEFSKDKRGQGHMDLWSMSSLYTELPQWKQCRGLPNEGPCPTHDPLGYNGLDALAVDTAWPRLVSEMAAKQIPWDLYERSKRLILLTDAMETQGIRADREKIAALEKEFNERKDNLFPQKWVPAYGKKGQLLKNPIQVWDAPFNPRSPKAVMDWFGGRNVHLESTDKETVKQALENLSDSSDPLVRDLLTNLFDYKDAGKGLGPWFDERYFHNDNLLHPRFIGVGGTSMGRLASSNPNFQNIPARGFGKNVRRVIIPRDPSLKLIKADKSQLELRICLWYAGVEPPRDDAFTWLVKEGNGEFERAAELVGGGKTPRDITKSVSHGGNYGEGLKILYARDLDSPRTKQLIERGALLVVRDWHYAGGVVGFTGVNLAERLFGSASWENRAKALAIQEIYFKRFRAIRSWQQRVSEQAELGYTRTASGRYLRLLGTPEDRLKAAFAMHGQGGGAEDVIDAMLRYGAEGFTPLIQVHDELVFECDRGWSDTKVLDFFRIFSAPSETLTDFSCPVKVSVGENWLDMTELGKV